VYEINASYTVQDMSISIEHVNTDIERMIKTVSRLYDKSEPYSQEMVDIDAVWDVLEDIFTQYKKPKTKED